MDPVRGIGLARGAAPLALAALLAAASCRTPPPEGPNRQPAPDASIDAAERASGRIVFDGCEPPEAVVLVDGLRRGTIAEISGKGGLELERGVHRIEIKAAGHRSFRLELKLGARQEKISVKLKRIAP